jgi:mono/diheme cytochrome c family protein
MKSILTIVAAISAVAVSVFALGSFANRAFGNSARQTAQQTALEHGRYIVHQVGMCIDCHSPRDKSGEFIEGQHLTGSPLHFSAAVAPKIAGLPPGFTAEDTVHFLMTGERPHGRPAPLPPMPGYRMNRRDAEAVTAYLHSLATATP